MLTRHVTDTTRLTQSVLRGFLNKEYQKLRSWLIDVAPQLYLVYSGNIVLPDPVDGLEVELESASFQYEKMYRVDQLDDDGNQWLPVEPADLVSYNLNQTGRVTFREEGGLCIFGPEDNVDGTFRIVFHATPPALTVAGSNFLIPHQLEDALKYATCIKVAISDGDSPKEWEDRLKAELKEAEPVLRKRWGQHQSRPGIRKILGY